MLYLRNNLTVVEPVWVTGEAEGPSLLLVDPEVWDSYTRFKRSSRRTTKPELSPISTVRLVVKNDAPWESRNSKLTARRQFLLVNTGRLTVHVRLFMTETPAVFDPLLAVALLD